LANSFGRYADNALEVARKLAVVGKANGKSNVCGKRSYPEGLSLIHSASKLLGTLHTALNNRPIAKCASLSQKMGKRSPNFRPHSTPATNESKRSSELHGTMSQRYCPNPSEFERVQYMKAIQTYTPKPPVLADTAYHHED
jgi:hypothetical protein